MITFNYNIKFDMLIINNYIIHDIMKSISRQKNKYLH